MTRRVGEHNIREDLYDSTVEKVPKGIPRELLDRANSLRNAHVGQPEQRAQTTEIRTLSEFYDFFRKVVAAAEEIDGRAYSLRFSESHIPIDEELPCFTARLNGRVPWADNAGRRERAPRYIETKPDPDQPGNQVEIYIHRFANDVEITVWAATNKVANDHAEWLEEKFFEYLWAFQWGGFSHPVVFNGRGQDITDDAKGQILHGRPLRFSVITGRITKRNVATMRRVRMQLGISRPDEADSAG